MIVVGIKVVMVVEDMCQIVGLVMVVWREICGLLKIGFCSFRKLGCYEDYFKGVVCFGEGFFGGVVVESDDGCVLGLDLGLYGFIDL